MENDDLLANVTEVAGSKVLPPCVITGRLGRGGMGAVYRARHLNLAIDVAVKVLKPQLVEDDPQFVARFKREGQSAAAISHQNVIRVFDVAESLGLHYIIMELVVGETARQRVDRKGPLAVDEALQVFYEAALGLGAAHALGIVHRDVKPDNLLIANTGQLKVADLGLAKPTLGTGGASLMSTANQVMGTPSYMPPEQWESPAVGPAADVWALGTTLWFLLTGEDAFDSRDGNYPRVMKQILLQPFPDLRARRPEVPEGVLTILAKATAKEVAARYADANELAAAIEQLGLRKVSLRDRGDTTEAKTMVSPSPRNLEQIKQWLREDNLTRMQTPSGSRPATSGQRALAGAGGTIPHAAPVTGASTLFGSRRSRKLWYTTVALLAAAGGGAGYWVSQRPPDEPKGPVVAKEDAKVTPTPGDTPKDQPTDDKPLAEAPPKTEPKTEPQPEPAPAPKTEPPAVVPTPVTPPPDPAPFADVDRLAADGRLADALAAYEAVVATKAELADGKRKAGLLGRRGEQQAQAKDYRGALLQLQQAVALDDSWRARQTQLRTEALEFARASLRIERPTAPLARGAMVEFVATLPLDAVAQVRVGEMLATSPAPGRYTAMLPAGTTQLPIRLRLVDGDDDTLLQTLTVDYLPDAPPPPPPALTFATALAPTTTRARLVDGIVYSTRDTVEFAGTLNTPGAQLFFNDKPLKRAAEAAEAFKCSLPLGEAGEEVTLRLVAKKSGLTDAICEVRAVYLGKPTVELDPVRDTDRLTTEIRIDTGPGITTAKAKLGEQVVALRADRTGRTFRGQLPLVPGANAFVVTVSDVFDRTAEKNGSVQCTIKRAELTGVILAVDGVNRPLPRDQTVWIGAGTLDLTPRAIGTRVAIAVDGNPLPGGTGLVLTPKDGERQRLVVTARNELPAVDTWTVEIVRDETKPVLAVTSPKAGEALPPDAATTLAGTWSDAGGLASLTVDGAAATFLSPDAANGTWTFALPAPQTVRTLRVVARDRAGNACELDVPLTVATPGTPPPAPTAPAPATAKPAPRAFDGFTSKPDEVNDLGYAKVIVDTDTGIELVAVPFTDGKKPSLYVARRPVTELQFDGAGTNTTKLGVTGREVYNWLQARGRGLDLPTESEWAGLGDGSGVTELKTGPVEWLKPSSWATGSYPIVKGSVAIYKAGDSVNFAFRVVFRP